jgi:hypothetical protein
VAQHVDVSDRFAAIGEHYRDIGQDPATVMDRRERAARHRLGQLGREPGPVGQQADRDTARVSHHADTLGGHGQPVRPRSTLHLRSAFQLGLLGLSQEQESQAGQALPCFYPSTAPPTRERSGLVRGNDSSAADNEP